MKLPDTNLLIYAVDESSQHHLRAAEWWNSVMSSGESVALAWVVMLAFLRLTTRAPVMISPLSVDEAFTIVNRWIDHSSTTIIQPRRRHHQVLQDLLLGVGTGGNLTTDAHLAALAIEHGAVLCTADNDFSRFSGLEWSNPLTGLGG